YILWGYHQNQQGNLLDMNTPGTNYADCALQIRNTFSDPAAGVTIKPLTKGGTTPNEYLDVQITVSPSVDTNTLAYESGTLAGAAGVQGFTNGVAADARFRNPVGITVDEGGNVYLADTDNAVIRKLTPEGQVTTFATGFSTPFNIAVDHA